MTDAKVRDLLDAEGPAAPPRRNGELVFQSPWESRLFGVTIALHRSGRFEWDEFRQLLIDEIARWERLSPDDRGEWAYYERWQAALERLLAEQGLCATDQLERRVDELKRRPAGHDH